MDKNSVIMQVDGAPIILHMPKKKAHANQRCSSVSHLVNIFQIPGKQLNVLHH